MKKIFSSLAVLALILSVFSCKEADKSKQISVNYLTGSTGSDGKYTFTRHTTTLDFDSYTEDTGIGKIELSKINNDSYIADAIEDKVVFKGWAMLKTPAGFDASTYSSANANGDFVDKAVIGTDFGDANLTTIGGTGEDKNQVKLSSNTKLWAVYAKPVTPAYTTDYTCAYDTGNKKLTITLANSGSLIKIATAVTDAKAYVDSVKQGDTALTISSVSATAANDGTDNGTIVITFSDTTVNDASTTIKLKDCRKLLTYAGSENDEVIPTTLTLSYTENS